MEALAGRGEPGADVSTPSLFPIPWDRISKAQVSDAGLYTCIASSRAGVADRSFVLQIRGMGNGEFGESRPEGAQALTLLSEHVLCFAALFPSGVLSCPLVRVCSEIVEQGRISLKAVPEQVPGTCQAHPQCLGTHLSSHNLL